MVRQPAWGHGKVGGQLTEPVTPPVLRWHAVSEQEMDLGRVDRPQPLLSCLADLSRAVAAVAQQQRLAPTMAILDRAGACSNAPDLGMRVWTMYKGGVHGPRRTDVIDMARAPGEKAEILAAGDGRTDVLGRPKAHRVPPDRIVCTAAKIEVLIWT